MKDRYPKEWDHLPSVTEVIGLITSPQLLNWFKTQAYRDIKQKSQKSIDIGKQVHAIIEKIEDGKPIQLETEYPNEIKNCVKAYFDWKKTLKLEIIASELKLISPSLNYKGTIDRIYRKDDKLILVDWKTSKSIYKESYMQVAAYANLYENIQGLIISECWIIRLGKEKAEFEPKKLDNMERVDAAMAFTSLLNVYRWYHKGEKK